MGTDLTDVASTGGLRAEDVPAGSASVNAATGAPLCQVRRALDDRACRITLFALFICQLAATIVVVPPWQNPDEPQHVMFASVMGKHGPAMLPNAFDDEIEGDIVRSMARHRWWQYYARPTPNPLPRSFAGIENVQMSSIQGPALYYIVSGALLQRLPVRDSTSRLYVLRTVSALLAMVALWTMFAGSQLWFGRTAAFVVSSMAALHPQFAIASTTAGPDAVINLAGAVLWWQAGRTWSGRAPATAIAGMWAAALVAASFARLGTPLIVLAFAVSMAALTRSQGPARRRVAVSLIVLALLLATLVAVTPAVLQSMLRIAAYAAAPIQMALGDDQGPRVSVQTWSEAFLGSVWLTAGWMRYPTPNPMLVAFAVVTGIAVVGLVRTFARQPSMRSRLALAGGFVIVQLAAVIVVYYVNNIGGQGRYLFPVLSAILALLWIGVRNVAPSIAEGRLAVAVVITAYACNVAAWGTVLLPVYAAAAL